MEENKILDAVNSNKNSKYTKRSIKALIFSLVIFAILIFLALIDTPGNKIIQFLSIFFALGFLASCLGGFIFAILSFVKSEPDTIGKIIAAIANFFIFIVMLGMVSFIMMDLMNAM